MPSKTVEAYAKESGKTVAEVEAIWNKCKEQAKKFHKDEDVEYWKFINMCTKTRLGLDKKKKKK